MEASDFFALLENVLENSLPDGDPDSLLDDLQTVETVELVKSCDVGGENTEIKIIVNLQTPASV